MKTTLASLLLSVAIAAPALAQDQITEFNIGVLGGENAQDRICLLYTSPSPRD